MKHYLSRLQIPALCVAFAALAQAAHAQSLWSAVPGTTSDLNWSTLANWTPNGVPDGSANVLFDSTTAVSTSPLSAAGAGAPIADLPSINSIVNLAFPGTISSLTYTNIGGLYQNTLLADGVTLNITNSGGLKVGNGGGSPGSSGSDFGSTTEFVTIAGPNATLNLNNTSANLWVALGSASSAGQATLDLSALQTFTANLSRVLVGVPAVNRPSGILYLAATNTIRAGFQTTSTETSGTVGTGAIDIGDASSNNGGNCYLYLGLANTISADTIVVGRQKASHGLIAFNPNLTTLAPSATFQGYSGARAQIWSLGDGVANSGTTTCYGAADFSLGIVNAAVDTVYIGRASTAGTGANKSEGRLTLAAGSFDVNSLFVGIQPAANAKFGVGTVDVKENTTLGQQATLIVHTNLTLGSAAGSSGAATTAGTLNIAGGTVLANNIVAGAGSQSTINLDGGKLVITNSAGTAATPLTTFEVSAGTLELRVAGAAAEIVTANLNVNGSATINIASLPVISHYPAQFPLIQYVQGSLLADFGLGSLPAGSPPYQGYISNNVGSSSIDLVLTNGFVPLGAQLWTGATSSDWDYTTANWTLFGNPATFKDGALVEFQDTASSTGAINLTAALQPSSVTVSNNSTSYTFGGPGSLADGASLTKSGDGLLILANDGNNTFSGGVVINGGTLQFGNGGTNGNLPANAQPITDNGSLVFNKTDNVNVFNAISGIGNVIQAGAGVLSLGASNSYTGPTLAANGTLLVNGTLGGGGVLTNASGTTIGGLGTTLGPLEAAGLINPGNVNGIGTLTAGGGATLHPGAALAFDLNAADTTPGSGSNDLLQVIGNLTVNNNAVHARIQGIPQPGLTYNVITYSGTLNGSFNPAVAGTHYTATLDTSIPGQVNVTITGGTGANLKWNSTGSGLWDLDSSRNWLNLATSQPDVFAGGDNVLFDDSVAGAQTNITIPAGIVLAPAAITNISSVNNYTISGGGTISGPAVLVKGGDSTLTLSTANSFSGGVTVMNGTLRTGNGSALGTGTATVNNGATLDVNGQNLGSRQVDVGGNGVGGNGAIVNSGAQQINALKNVTLTGDTTFGGIGRWDIRGSGATFQASGSPVTITKVGTNQVSLVACTCNDANLANVNILQGTFALQTSTTQFGDPAGFINVSSNALLEVWGLTAGLTKNVVLFDGGGLFSENGSTTLSGTVTLTNNAAGTGPGTGKIVNNNNTTLIVSSVIQGPGNLVKSGTGTTQLGAANTYTGGTTVSAGTLMLNSGSTIANSPAITVASGATLDVTQVAPFTLASGQSLQGAGTVNGDLIVGAGATLMPGSATAAGTLTVSNNVTLQGAVLMKLDASASANDALVSAATSFSGTLTVTNIAGTLAAGQSFRLFRGPVSGAFSAVTLPTLPSWLSWSNTLAMDGTLAVISSGTPPQPRLTSISISGGNLVINGANAPAGQSYVLLGSTNVALPLGQWVPLATNTFANGTFSMTNAVNPAVPAQYFILQLR